MPAQNKNRPDNILSFFPCESYSIIVIAYQLKPKRKDDDGDNHDSHDNSNPFAPPFLGQASVGHHGSPGIENGTICTCLSDAQTCLYRV